MPTIGHRRPLDEALRLLQEKSAPAVAVVDPSGRLVGLVTPETIGEMMMVHEALPKGATLRPVGHGRRRRCRRFGSARSPEFAVATRR